MDKLLFNKIFSSENIDQYGFCDYGRIQQHLLNCRAKARLPQDSKSIISFIIPYKTKKGVFSIGEYNPFFQNISSYAISEDYHLIASKIINNLTDKLLQNFPNEQFIGFCDNSPIPEVRTACLCGLGVVGNNTLLINKKYGSYVFIAEIVTTLDLSDFYNSALQLDRCINCNRCIEKCPTSAIVKINNNYTIDETLCLSAITQKKKPLDENQIKAIKENDYVWGCDRCQLNCVMNIKSQLSPILDFENTTHTKITIDNAMQLENRAYLWRGEKVITRNILLIRSEE